MVYTLGGANGFDVSATPSVVDACVDGINKAYDLAEKFNKTILTKPFITVSVGMPGDHHVRKAFIVDDCVDCGLCIPVCPTDAIPENYDIIREICIGCGNCEAVCPPKVAAIRYEHNAKKLEVILPECIRAGAENIELHAAVADDGAIMEEWKVVCDAQPNNFVSMCLDRLHLSNHHFLDRIRGAKNIAGDRLIIQADGVPMSGGNDNFNTTLQAVATADVVYTELIKKELKLFKKLPVLLSGGTNSKTGEMAKLCNVPYAGVSIGTHARAIVQTLIDAEDFYSNDNNMIKAIDLAEDLVVRSM